MGTKHSHPYKCAGGCCGHEVERVPVSASTAEIGGVSRRTFLLGLGTATLAQWAVASASAAPRKRPRPISESVPPEKELVVQPVLTYGTYQRRPKTSWRPWGGIMTQEDADRELERLKNDLARLARSADFAVRFLPVVGVRGRKEAAKLRDGDFDVMLIFAAGAGRDVLETLVSPKRPTIIFVRHRSGPVYLWYEIVHPRFLRKTVDEYGQPGVDIHDVVVDEYDDLMWRLRGLFGLKNAWGERIVAVGGPGGWGAGGRKAPRLAREKWYLEIIPVSYDELGKRLKKAMADDERAERARVQAAAYLRQPRVRLETKREFVERCFFLTDVFKDLLRENDARAITINQCMGTIMRVSNTTACLPLSLLNDEGYMAFCESDFVVIPSGILLHHISGLPVFLNDPTYPHHGIVTMAHCTAPRRMDGRRCEPTRIMTHFESDFGAAPKVTFRKGQTLTVINPDFAEKRWMGFRGKVLETPFMPICRSQVDAAIEGDWQRLLEGMRGFHWMACYGDFRKEVGYALRKAGIEWVDVSQSASA